MDTHKNSFNQINIAGVKISNVDITQTMQLFNNWINLKQKKRVCVTPVNCIVWANENQELKSIYNSADLVLCDGVPLIWFSKFLKTPLKARVTGLDLLPQYVKVCYQNNYTMFLLGAKEGVADYFKNKLEQKYPGIKIVGTYCPPFAEKFSEEENNNIIDQINHLKPNVLWVSLTAPKQDFWISENLEKLNVNIAIGVGGAFEVTAGLISRSPIWMQKFGLEWLHRLIKEPVRMYKRYLIEAPKIFRIILNQKIHSKFES